MGIEKKVVLITGGSRGIGKSMVEGFAKKGAKVVFSYVKNDQIACELRDQLVSYGYMVEAVKSNVSDFEQAKQLVNQVVTTHGSINVLINNAGKCIDSTLLMMSKDSWDDVINTNLSGIFNVTKNCIFHMLKNKSGRIINISSTSAITGVAGQTNYSASKAGIIGFSRALAKEVAAYGICVNVIAPGGVTTDMIDKISEDARNAILKSAPINRFCYPGEVFNVANYLAYESPDYLTGNVIVLDGGAGIG